MAKIEGHLAKVKDNNKIRPIEKFETRLRVN